MELIKVKLVKEDDFTKRYGLIRNSKYYVEEEMPHGFYLLSELQNFNGCWGELLPVNKKNFIEV